MATYSDELLEQLLKCGDEQYNAMVSHFEEIFDGKNMPHFTIRSEGVYDLGSEKVMKEHGNNIEKELLLWIDKQYKEGELFVRSKWKMFHDRYSPSYMYLGYKTLFQYKNYYFGLIFDKYCMKDIEDCMYCMKHEYDIKYDKEYHFQLLFHGSKNENEILKIHNKFLVSPDNILPDDYWKLL